MEQHWKNLKPEQILSRNGVLPSKHSHQQHPAENTHPHPPVHVHPHAIQHPQLREKRVVELERCPGDLDVRVI